MPVTLIAADGRLCLPSGATLLCVYPAGDCDTVPFPRPLSGYSADYWTVERWSRALGSALYDAREMGELPAECASVLLPDGAEVSL